MPNYTYECERCRDTLTIFQTYCEFDENPTPDCPKCGGALNDDNDCWDCGYHVLTREEEREARADIEWHRDREER